ncbi:MAG: M20/M25/M40 family metallo-hydrolase [Propionibacteriaceae bacterium]|jgi:glutamate carboxypeptidase|nr:M20/M25/M40 family metallo-hydrolase [Propionibacteriaceae bacterium]
MIDGVALLRDLVRLVECESPSGDLDALAAGADLVAELGQRRLGRPPESVTVEGRRHLRWRLGSGGGDVLVLTHYDTVWPLGSLADHPCRISPSERGEALTGPGCFDMKAGLAMAWQALAALAPAPGRGVTLLATADEEIGSPSSRQLIEAEAARARAVLVLESPAAGGALKTARKGVSLYQVEISGRAAHAGLEPERGVNATVELAHLVLALAALADPERGTSVTPTWASSGSSTNTVPARASLAVDVRAWTMAEQDRVDQALTRLAPVLPGARLEVRGGHNRPPFEADRSAELFELARRLGRAFGLELASAAVGGASDGNFTAGLGVPTLDGLGAEGGGAHADHEHVWVDSLEPRTALLKALLDHLLADAGPPGPAPAAGGVSPGAGPGADRRPGPSPVWSPA